jgi:HSP20 family protein
MELEKWHPLKEIESMRREMDRMWEGIFPTPRRSLLAPWRRLPSKDDTAIPAIDVIDRADEILVRCEMPGVEKENIDVSVHEDTLTVKGEVEKDNEYKDEDYYHSERTCRSYKRSIHIPEKVKADEIEASLKDGMLNVHLPKAEELKPRKIKVEVSD